MKVSLPLERLKQAMLADRSNFTFIVGRDNKKYSCCLFQACLISQKVCKLVSADPTCGCLRVAADSDCVAFDMLEKLWNGDVIDVSESCADDLVRLCLELENGELLSRISRSENTTIHNAINHMKLGITNDNEIEFIASHFSELAVSDLVRLPASDIEMILTHKALKLSSENTLFDVIEELMQLDPSYSTLLSCVRFEYLDRDHADKFFKRIYPDFVDSAIWNSVTNFVLRFIETDHHHNTKIFEYNESKPMNGIFAWMRGQCGGNPHEKGAVTITVSSTSSSSKPAYKVLDYGEGDRWRSLDREPGEWIQFEFKNSVCSLSSYSIRSGPGCYPRKWVIECSNDGSTWIAVDERCTEEIEIEYSISHFSCNRPTQTMFKYIRLMLTGKNATDDFEINMSEIEFFGRLQ